MITLTERPYLQPLREMPQSDLAAEGGYWATLQDYIGEANPEAAYVVVRFSFNPCRAQSPRRLTG